MRARRGAGLLGAGAASRTGVPVPEMSAEARNLVEELFKLADQDDSGKISDAEFAAACGTTAQVSAELLPAHFAELDENEGGAVHRAEWSRWMGAAVQMRGVATFVAECVRSLRTVCDAYRSGSQLHPWIDLDFRSLGQERRRIDGAEKRGITPVPRRWTSVLSSTSRQSRRPTHGPFCLLLMALLIYLPVTAVAIDVYALLPHPTNQFYYERSTPAMQEAGNKLANGELDFQFHWYKGAVQGSASADRSGYLEQLRAIKERIESRPGVPAAFFSWDISLYGPGFDIALTESDFKDLIALNVPLFWQDKVPFQNNLTTLITPDDYQGGFDISKVYCRLAGTSSSTRRLITLRGPLGHINCLRRVAGFREGLVAHGCSRSVSTPEDLDANLDWDREEAKKFVLQKLSTSKVDGIFSCNDGMIDGAIEAVNLVRATGTHGLLLSGYDAIPSAMAHLKDGSLYATVNVGMFYSSYGMIPTLISLFRFFDYSNPVGLGTLSWPVALQTSVMDSYVRGLVLTGYDPDNAPYPTTPLRISIRRESVRNVNLVEAMYTMSGRMTYRWTDPRIKYLSEVWGNLERLQFGEDELWKPRMRPKEFISWQSSIAKLQADPDGNVEMVEIYTVTSSCEFKLHAFPADTHVCKMDLELDKSGIFLEDFTVAEPEYDLVGWRSVSFAGAPTANGAVFTVTLKREHTAYFLPVVFPTIVVSVISLVALTFESFDLRVNSEVLAFLTAVAVRSSASAYLPSSATLTWLDWWLLGCVGFQLVPFFFITTQLHVLVWRRWKMKKDEQKEVLVGSYSNQGENEAEADNESPAPSLSRKKSWGGRYSVNSIVTTASSVAHWRSLTERQREPDLSDSSPTNRQREADQREADHILFAIMSFGFVLFVALMMGSL